MLSRSALDVLSFGNIHARSTSGSEEVGATLAGEGELVSLLLLLAADVVAGVGLRSALRSFLLSHVPLIEFSTGVEVNTQQLEQQEQRARPITPPLRDPAKAPFIINIKGLMNKGQTCYANSVMQALASLQPLYIYVDSLQKNDRSEEEDHESISFAFYQTLKHINGLKVTRSRRKRSFLSSVFSPSTPGDPQQVMNVVAQHHSQFRSRNSMGMAGMREQQDSHEYFSALMDVLSSSSDDQNEGGKQSSPNTVNTASRTDKSLPLFADSCDDGCKESTRGNIDLENDELEEEKKHDECNHNNLGVHNNTQQTQEEYLTYKKTNSHSEASGPSEIRNPFDGWSESTIKCAVCHHVRPTRNTPFLGLSLPIANVPSEFLEDFLTAEFATEELSNVQCFSCAIRQRIQGLEEEYMLLRGAISSIRRRSTKGKEKTPQRKNSQTVEDPNDNLFGLVNESQQIQQKIAFLENLDPDSDDDKLDCQDCKDDEHGIELNGSLSPILPLRREALLYKAMRPPEALCIHLQRRHYDVSCQRMTKVMRHVHFEEELDIRPYCAYDPKVSYKPYKLMSVIEHVGNAFGGHYQTYRRVGPEQDGWVLVSDEIVSFRSWNDVRRCQAYMLFYVACRTNLI